MTSSMMRDKRFLAISAIIILFVSAVGTSIPAVQAEQNDPFDLEIERDPNTLKPKIMVLKEENKVAVKVRNNGPNSTTCQVGIRVWGLNADGSKGSFKGSGTSLPEDIPVPPETQKWIFIPVGNIDINEPLKVEAYVANEIDVMDPGYTSIILGDDTNPTNNEGSRNFNVESRVSFNSIRTLNFVIENPSETEDTTILIRTEPLAPVPTGWVVFVYRFPDYGIIVWGAESSASLTLKSGKSFQGSFTVQAPEMAVEGDYVNVKVSAVNAASGESIFADEFYVAYDTLPPEIVGETISVDGNTLEAKLRVRDSGSGVELAEIYFSTDNGETWASKQMSYSFNMENVTGELTSRIGPFPYGTEARYYFLVKDGAGNWVSTSPESRLILPMVTHPSVSDVEVQPLNINSEPETEFQAGETVLPTATIMNTGGEGLVLIAVQIFDPEGTAVPSIFVRIKLLTSQELEFSPSFVLPADAKAGEWIIEVNVFDDFPARGGTTIAVGESSFEVKSPGR